MKTKTKKVKKVKAVWRGWGIKDIHHNSFVRLYSDSPEISVFKCSLDQDVMPPDEKVVEVEVREI